MNVVLYFKVLHLQSYKHFTAMIEIEALSQLHFRCKLSSLWRYFCLPIDFCFPLLLVKLNHLESLPFPCVHGRLHMLLGFEAVKPSGNLLF